MVYLLFDQFQTSQQHKTYFIILLAILLLIIEIIEKDTKKVNSQLFCLNLFGYHFIHKNFYFHGFEGQKFFLFSIRSQYAFPPKKEIIK